ncbi:SixA phosphatase family protein [Marinicella sediminis]|uniref:SixA phosphatase family protein n=1 Tax=Marinicella sediminis TaxID=1792834 RepID=A0ABV7JBK1_9GAMM|nr:histidine phosphatase family protein [Marinicella sediminis]
MKVIHFIRHAKSSWDDPRLSDLKRPLKGRGRRDCALMAEPLWDLGWRGQQVYCSAATRAQQTIAGISEALSGRSIDWVIEPELYTFSSSAVLSFLESLDDSLTAVTLVGHNPAFTDVIDHLTDDSFEHLPTCAYARVEAAVPEWSSLSANGATLKHFLKPKMLK